MPTIQYRTPDGQVQETDLQNAPPQIQALYNTNYAQPQSQTQTAGAQATTNTITSQQTGAPQALSADLKKGMTLGDAMSKYKALKMSADDIFNQYLSENTYGENGKPKLPVENLTQLQGMGVTGNALGKIGDIGSFTDKYNAKNAIDELRLAKSYFDKTKADDIAGNVAGVNNNSAAYENARTIAGLHLSSLIPGASGAQATGNTLLDLLPSSKDIRSYTPEQADAKFSAVEKTLLASRGYDYSALNLNDPYNLSETQQKPTTGGGLLKTLLTGATSDVKGLKATSDSTNLIGLLTNPDARSLIENAALHPLNTAKGMGSGILNMLGVKSNVDEKGNMQVQIPKSGDELLKNILDNAEHHPVNTAMTVLGPLLGLGGEASTAEEGAMGATAESIEAGAGAELPKVPGSLSTKINPGKTMDVGGQYKDAAVKTIKDSGNMLNPKDILSKIQEELPTLRAAFSGGLVKKDFEGAFKDLQDQFSGNSMTPDQAKAIYDRIPSGYTRTGIAKEDFASELNRVKRDAISSLLNDKSGGLWQKGVDAQSASFRGTESQTNKIIKNLPANATKAGLQATPLAFLAHLLNGR